MANLSQIVKAQNGLKWALMVHLSSKPNIKGQLGIYRYRYKLATAKAISF